MKSSFFIGLLLIFTLGGCAGPSSWFSTEDRVIQYSIPLDTLSDTIRNAPEFQDCIEPAVNMCISSVGMQLAQNKKSIEFCNELPSLEQQESCRFAITLSNARESGDVNGCNSLKGNYQDQCLISAYKNIASIKKDISLCDTMFESITKTHNGSGSGFTESLHMHHDQCVLGVVISDKDIKSTTCDIIADPGIKESCLQATRGR